MSDPHSRPARPHHRFTEDGRRIREVLSYSRRGSRFTPRQQRAWDAYNERWVVSDEALETRGFSWAGVFGGQAPMIVEIGSGVGEATVATATKYADHQVVALEVWRPGVADTLARLSEVGLDNVRLVPLDAEWVLGSLFGPGSLAQLHTFFPDPWPKTRHHKRRLVSRSFVAMAAQRLQSGGWWRLATDWADYAQQMQEVLDAEPALRGGPVQRWSGRPLTRFERKGLAAGREIVDLAYTRV